MTRIRRPELEESEIDLVENGSQLDVDHPQDTAAQSDEQSLHQLPVLTANPVSNAASTANNVIVVPSSQAPVVGLPIYRKIGSV